MQDLIWAAFGKLQYNQADQLWQTGWTCSQMVEDGCLLLHLQMVLAMSDEDCRSDQVLHKALLSSPQQML